MSLDALAKLWAAGKTLTQIERATGVSRGVAIGRIHRARKAGDPRFQPRPKPPVKARRLKPVDEVVGNRRPLPPPPPESRPVPFLTLRPACCKFPLNSPERGRLYAELLRKSGRTIRRELLRSARSALAG